MRGQGLWPKKKSYGLALFFQTQIDAGAVFPSPRSGLGTPKQKVISLGVFISAFLCFWLGALR